MSDIPERKHDVNELDDIRRRNAFQVRPPIQHVKSLELNLVLTVLLYALMVAGLVVTSLQNYIVGLSLSGASLLASILVFWKKPRSTHHAVIISIISLLVLVFGFVYYSEQFEHAAHEDTQGSTRY